ncbi:amidohydrolase [Shewanella canadensis]|uniref:Amidohydrolase n=1 Tax=Shewanella canadensis TaxID=271096 RepID=A0A431WT17_9GAMM|nr:amidohydrolase [Shewanella canadensis]RTR38760.1 amidohydrolase [Shewanella canadensis]
MKRIASILINIGVIAFLSACADKNSGSDEQINSQITKVYVNGRVYTQDNAAPWAEGFVVIDDKFVAVGDAESLKSWMTPESETIDLAGQFVMPGFVEEHIHPDMATESYLGINIVPSMGWDKVSHIIETFGEQKSDDKWIIGGALNWLADNGEKMHQIDALSHFTTLDKLINDKPLLLWDVGGHAVLINSLGLKKLGIDENSTAPEGGIIVKDKDGQPTGVLRETAANMAYEIALKDLPKGSELINSGIKPIFSQLNQFGITSITDAWARAYMLDAYKTLADSGELTLRIKAYIADPIEWLSPEWKEAASNAIANHQAYKVDHWLNADGVKFVLDGSAGGQTIIMVEPYEGTSDQHGGPWRNDPVYFAEKFSEYDKKGHVMKVHAVGSQSIRTALDAIEKSRENGSTLRHNIAHTVFVHPDDIMRFKEHNVGVEFSPHFWYPVSGWDIIRDELGQRRLDWAFPFNTLKNEGVAISVGSDWPVAESPNPFLELETMVTRQAPGGGGEILSDPKERISLSDAIEVFTIGGAFAQNREDIIGTIETGKLADFIILNQNLFEIEINQVHKTRVIQTVVGGKTVYETKTETEKGTTHSL